MQKQIEADPVAYGKLKRDDGSLAQEYLEVEPKISWDGQVTRQDARKEGSNTQTEAEQKGAYVQADVERVDREAEQGVRKKVSDLELEPALTADQYVTLVKLKGECEKS